MFRSVQICRAPLATLKPILAASVTAQNTVERFLGTRFNRAPDVNAVNSVVEKTKGEGIAGNTAAVARAWIYLASFNPSAALEEVNHVLPQIKDEALRRTAIGLRLRARNELLDIKEAALNVSGGATEMEVSAVRTQVQQDYDALRASSPDCWLVALAAAEYCLYTGKADEAYRQLCNVEKKIIDFIETPIKLSDDIASAKNTAPFTLLGFKLQRSCTSVSAEPNTDALIAEVINNMKSDPSIKNELDAFKKQMGVDLTDEEAVELVYTLQAVNIRHHFHDFFSPSSEYSVWTSDKAKKAQILIQNAAYPTSANVPESVVERARSEIPPKAFFDSEVKLLEVLKSTPKTVSAVTAIRTAFGPGPQAPPASADEMYAKVMQDIRKSNASKDMAGSLAYAGQQREIATVAARQILYRTQVQIGVALTELNRLYEAVDKITPVIDANEFVFMWRAFLARSRAYKGLGLISKADHDLKSLVALKTSLTEHAPYAKE